jgi:transcriptional regulator with XRE-family HTH domain
LVTFDPSTGTKKIVAEPTLGINGNMRYGVLSSTASSKYMMDDQSGLCNMRFMPGQDGTGMSYTQPANRDSHVVNMPINSTMNPMCGLKMNPTICYSHVSKTDLNGMNGLIGDLSKDFLSLNRLDDDNVYKKAKWDEIFDRVSEVIKIGKLRQKQIASEIGVSGSTLSSMLRGKYKYTRQEHVDRLKWWCYNRDRNLIKRVDVCKSYLKLEGSLAKELQIEQEELDSFRDFTLDIAKRIKIDRSLLSWISRAQERTA